MLTVCAGHRLLSLWKWITTALGGAEPRHFRCSSKIELSAQLKLQFKGREVEDTPWMRRVMVGFGAGGPAKSDSSAGNSEPGVNPESRVQDTEPANCELRTGATPDSFARSRGLLRRVKGLFKDFIRCYEECRPEQPSLTRARPGTLPLPRSVQDPKLVREEDQNVDLARELDNAKASERSTGVGNGCMGRWGYSMGTVWPVVLDRRPDLISP